MENEMIVRLDSASPGYNGKAVLKALSFTVGKGEILVLIGPNGSGKSTILKSIAGQLEAVEGTVRVLGQDPNKEYRRLAKERAVLSTESVKAEGMRAEEIVMLGRYPFTGRFQSPSPEDLKRVGEAMTEMEILEIRDRRFETLSDGQKQRVLIARALAQAERLLILDEPMTYLDIHYKLGLIRVLRKRAADGMTVIAALHEIELARLLADRILPVTAAGPVMPEKTEEIFCRERITKYFSITDEEYDILYG